MFEANRIINALNQYWFEANKSTNALNLVWVEVFKRINEIFRVQNDVNGIYFR